MLIVRGDQTINLDNVVCMTKYEDLKAKCYTIEFSFPAGRQLSAVFRYEDKGQRDIDYCKIIEGYNQNYRIVDL